MAVTTYDIAKIAKTTQATVSRALRNDPTISERTQKRIKKLADQLGYRPNLLARSLIEGKTYTIGLLMSAYHLEVASAKILAIDRLAREKGYHIYIGYTKGELPLAVELAQDFISRGIDGLLVYGSFDPYSEHQIRKLTKLKPDLPIVFLEANLSFPCWQVNSDKKQAYTDAVKYLTNRGYDKIYAFWKNMPDKDMRKDPRYLGLIEGLNAVGVNNDSNIQKLFKNILSSAMMGSDEKIQQLADRIKEFFLSHRQRCAIICYNDLVAIQTVSIANQLGIKIPDELAVIGFDDITATRLVVPPITTIAQPIEQLATNAVDMLINLIENPNNNKPETIMVPCELKIRATA